MILQRHSWVSFSTHTHLNASTHTFVDFALVLLLGAQMHVPFTLWISL